MFLEKIAKTLKQVPRRTVIYGCGGIGKSTLAANLYGREHTIFVPTEDGLSNIDVDAFPIAKNYQEAYGPVIELGGAVHKYRCVVIDSADWLEQLIWQSVCQDGGKKAITDFDFGKGYGSASAKFAKYLQALDVCRENGMHVIVIAHDQVIRFNSPEGESYHRFGIKMHQDSAELLHEWADEVLFATYRKTVMSEDQGFGKTRGIAVGDGSRVLKCAERPAYLAKNRMNMPDEIEMRVSVYQSILEKAGVSPEDSDSDDELSHETDSPVEQGKPIEWEV